MRTRILLATAALTCGLFAGTTTATASDTESCELTVSDLYISIAMQTGSAHLDGCNGQISNIEMVWGTSPDGPFTTNYPADYFQTSDDGSRATAYFLDPEERGYCKAKATAGNLTAYSTNAVSC